MTVKRTIRKTSLFLLATSVLFSGCQWLQDPKTLLKEPRLSADEANLQSIIRSQLPGGASMIRPRNDASKIQIADLDNDGQGEAIVFYETPDKEVRIHGMIFKSIGGVWGKLFDFDGEGIQIDRVDPIDITGDKKLELIVGYDSNDSELNKGLVAYTFTDMGMNKWFEEAYSHYVIDDLDGSGLNRLYILNNRLQQSPVLTVYQFQLDKMMKLHGFTLASATTLYTNMGSGWISKNRKGIVLDAKVSANHYISDIIGLNKQHRLEWLLERGLAKKSSQIPSSDMNRDGVIEIAIPVKPVGWESHEPYEIPYFTRFYQWNGRRGLCFVEQQYRDDKDRFYLEFPKSWSDRVTVDIQSNKDEELRFVDFHTNETFAIVKFFSPELWEFQKEKWTQFGSYGDKIIGIYSKEPLKINKGLSKILELNPNDRNGQNDSKGKGLS